MATGEEIVHTLALGGCQDGRLVDVGLTEGAASLRGKAIPIGVGG